MTRRHCTCTPENNPCGWCSYLIGRAEARAEQDPDPERVEAAERFYEKDLDRIGGSL